MRFVYSFDHDHGRPSRELAGLLGGKGANLAEMAGALQLPVPPGFTITTEACRAWQDRGWPSGLDAELADALAALEGAVGRRLGDPADPLLLSVRSGARFSMPGMMDTVLNLGLHPAALATLAAQHGEWFAADTWRRFVEQFGRVVLDVAGDDLAAAARPVLHAAGVVDASALDVAGLRALAAAHLEVVEERSGASFPMDPTAQLRLAVEAVLGSWSSSRAVHYRTREGIPHDLGTAVNVQAMVFGNRDDRSGTGVAFTRDPATGEAVPYGDFLLQAQGEDVVAGVRATEPLAALATTFPDVHAELLSIFELLERHYRDMLDIELTVESGRLWILQVRVGKRSGVAALRIAVELAADPVFALSHGEAVARVTPEHLEQILYPRFAAAHAEQLTAGLGASPGAAVGAVVLNAVDAVAARAEGRDVILVREETSPEDVAGMEAAVGVLTSRGGLVSHAAVVARGWGKPAVVGAEAVVVAADGFDVGDVHVAVGDIISIDGSTGAVVRGGVELAAGDPPPELDVVLGWADEIRAGHLGVRANADTGADAAVARRLGAEGIGLCRTEHQFLGDRLPVVQRMILADGHEAEAAALAELAELQRSDFVALLEAMDGLPVTIRLLDPPLHEFLPSIEEVLVAEAGGGVDDAQRALFAAARLWREDNPMLGTRGVRLGIIRDGLYRMQARAVAEATVDRLEAGGDPRPAIMIPLVVARGELTLVRGWVLEEVAAVAVESGRALSISVGTMIETPRAALLAEEIALDADFFSFGTNDLTQMTLGFSRDDVEGRIMPRYLEEGILPADPFKTIDRDGVGELVRLGIERGKAGNPELEIGVCGEHGGDPASIELLAAVGCDYVSCSPYRVPIARLAAAHAVQQMAAPGAAEADTGR